MRGARFLSILAIAIAWLMIFARLGELPLRDPDEGRNTQIAREMAQSHSWLTPTYLGLTYLDKPSFFYKCVSLSMQAFGENEAAARIPSALFACGILLMIYRFCRREYDSTTAAFAVIVVAASPLFLALARHVIFDMTLAFFVSGAIFAGYYAEAAEGARRRNLYLLGAAASGFATLVKGPVGFIVPVLVLAVFNIADKRKGWWKRMFHSLNILLFFAVVLPWFIGLSIQHPDFPHYGLVEESLNRFATKSFKRTAPFYYYGLVILGGLFAWSLILPGAIRAAWQNRSNWTRADRFLIVWSIVVTIFFSLSKSKLPHYIITAIVALGILTARILASALANNQGAAARTVFRSLVLLACVSVGFAGFLLFAASHPEALKIKSREFANVSLVFTPAAILLIVIAAAAIIGRLKRDLRVAVATFLILPIAAVTIGFGAIARYSEASSSRELAAQVRQAKNSAPLVCLQSFATGLEFYLKEPFTVITEDGSEFTSNYIPYALRNSTQWPPQLIRAGDRDKWLAEQRQPLYIIAKDLYKPHLNEVAAQYGATIQPLTKGWWGVLIRPKS